MNPAIPIGRNTMRSNLNATIETGVHSYLKFQNEITVMLVGYHEGIGCSHFGNSYHFTILNPVGGFSVELRSEERRVGKDRRLVRTRITLRDNGRESRRR